MVENKIRELIDKLNYYTKLYDEGKPEISDQEWDDMYFELQSLENFYNIFYEDSPTQSVNYQVVNKLNKVQHSHPMLSLDKTKDLEVIKSFVQGHDYVCMEKMDGLTCSLTYKNGKLIAAETRGNGLIGEDILHNALQVKNIPNKIKKLNTLVIDGEIICTEKDFKEFQEEYKNPRNFASGSIRLLDSEESAARHLTFVAWDCVEGLEDIPTLVEKLTTLRRLGFTIVDNCKTNNVEEDVELLKVFAQKAGYPIDGMVFKYNDCKEYIAAGRTDHHFKGGLAYKFYDEEYETKLLSLDYDVSRYGVLTPVAVFEPVDIDGSIVSRASLSNISVLEDTLGVPYRGQHLWITKRNMIIPKVERAEKLEYDINDEIHILSHCPSCGSELVIKQDNASKILCCPNDNCEFRLINHLNHFANKNGMDIKGLSKATLEKLIEWGWVSNYIDIYKLENKSNEWKNKAGFGEKSVERILEAIEFSKNTTLDAVIAAAGIPLIGRAVAKELCKYLDSYEDFRNKVNNNYDFTEIDGFGEAMSNALLSFDYTELDDVVAYALNIQTNEKQNSGNSLEGLTFCVTGKVHIYKNRDELKADIESRGGKVVGSMSGKVNYLVNNDINSTSSKNNAAKSAGIPIITEEQLRDMF